MKVVAFDHTTVSRIVAIDSLHLPAADVDAVWLLYPANLVVLIPASFTTIFSHEEMVSVLHPCKVSDS